MLATTTLGASTSTAATTYGQGAAGPAGDGPERSTSSTYLANGERVLRVTPDGSRTLLVAGMEIAAAAGNVHARRTYNAGGTTVATRGADGLVWLLADHQGTGQIAVPAGSTTPARQRRLPYGAERGPGGQLPGERDFLGHIKDDTTGLINVGARWYDPDRGQFLSPDPLAATASPQTLAAYSYSSNSPISFSDPTGLISIDALVNQIKRIGGKAVINRNGGLDWKVDTRRISEFRAGQRLSSALGRIRGVPPRLGPAPSVRSVRTAPTLGLDDAVDNYFQRTYRQGSKIPNGSGGALEWELENQQRYRSSTGHLTKVRENIRAIDNMFKRDQISDANRQAMLDERRYLEQVSDHADDFARANGIDDLKEEMRKWPEARDPTPPGGPGLIERIAGAIARQNPLLMIPFPAEMFDPCTVDPGSCTMTA